MIDRKLKWKSFDNSDDGLSELHSSRQQLFWETSIIFEKILNIILGGGILLPQSRIITIYSVEQCCAGLTLRENNGLTLAPVSRSSDSDSSNTDPSRVLTSDQPTNRGSLMTNLDFPWYFNRKQKFLVSKKNEKTFLTNTAVRILLTLQIRF